MTPSQHAQRTARGFGDYYVSVDIRTKHGNDMTWSATVRATSEQQAIERAQTLLVRKYGVGRTRSEYRIEIMS